MLIWYLQTICFTTYTFLLMYVRLLDIMLIIIIFIYLTKIPDLMLIQNNITDND